MEKSTNVISTILFKLSCANICKNIIRKLDIFIKVHFHIRNCYNAYSICFIPFFTFFVCTEPTWISYIVILYLKKKDILYNKLSHLNVTLILLSNIQSIFKFPTVPVMSSKGIIEDQSIKNQFIFGCHISFSIL